MLDPVEPSRAQPLRSADRGQIGHVVGDGVEHQVDRHPGEVGADAVVHTGAAEADVRVGVTKDVKGVRVLEHLSIEVRRTVEHHNPLARFDFHAAEFGVDDSGALECRDRRCPADDLVGGGGRTFPLVELPLIRVVEEGDHPVSDRVAGGLAAGDGQHQHEEGELVIGELLAVDVGVDQGGDDIVAGFLGLDRGQLHGVHQQLDRGRLAVDVSELGILVAGHLVGPAEELGPLVLGDAEKSGDHLQW